MNTQKSPFPLLGYRKGMGHYCDRAGAYRIFRRCVRLSVPPGAVFFITGYFIMKRNTGIRRFSTSAPVSPVHGPGICSTRCFCPAPQLFVTHRLYAGQELYNHTRMLTAWMSSLSFNSPEQVQGALWFLPVWLVSSGLFAGCVWFGRAAARFTRKDNVKLPVCAFACILIGLAGVFLNMRSCPLLTICRRRCSLFRSISSPG